jgi:hypothetical protein
MNMHGSFANEVAAGTQHASCGNEAIGMDHNDGNSLRGQINEGWLRRL